eukprot:UN20845
MISVEMIYVSFDASFEGLICSCKKNIYNGNDHFRKCSEIISFKEMPCNLRILAYSEK